MKTKLIKDGHEIGQYSFVCSSCKQNEIHLIYYKDTKAIKTARGGLPDGKNIVCNHCEAIHKIIFDD